MTTAEVLYVDPAIKCQEELPSAEVQELPGGGCDLCVPEEEGSARLLCSERCDGGPCEATSRFVVERSDGDQSFGWDGKHEACEGHLAEVVDGMIGGYSQVQAVVTIRWGGDDQ